MIVHAMEQPPPPELARALADFETQFRYPLGEGRAFTISHGDDYARFFRSMGEGLSFVAEREGKVVGTLGAAARRILDPNQNERRAAYFGDIKVAPGARQGRALFALLRASAAWAIPRVDCGYGVVMDGTPTTPEAYVGRLGIPAFEVVGKITVLQLKSPLGQAGECSPVNAADGLAAHRRLSRGAWTCIDGRPEERSEMKPRWLLLPDGSACGRLEDTLRAKRLFTDAGEEMRSAHLSCFAFEQPAAGAALLRSALRHAGALGFPAMFVAVPSPQADALRHAFDDAPLAVASATIYGARLPAGDLWSINTAEI
jgi:hypothetical protein